MELTDRNLAAAVQTLTPAERKVVADHLAGRTTDESWAVIRWLRRRLKRRVRSKRKR